ncbi:MAG: hypothetical protein RLZZ535_3648 [Cyanobacteriota bacterium]
MPPQAQAKATTKCTILDKELAKWLSIELKELDKVVDYFDLDPTDDWDLIENEDYIFINKKLKERRFSPRGALKIAAYFDHHEQRTIFYKIKDFITQHDERIRKALANQIIYEELSGDGKTITRNNRVLMHKQSLRRILETNGSRFNRSFNELQKSQMPLELDSDYAEIENNVWFFGSGAVRIAKDLGENLTNKSRKKMCQVIGGRLDPVLKQIETAQAKQQQQISKAKDAAKRRDKQTCQITKTKSSKYDQFNLAAHHLYCIKTYPHLATSLDNLISIRENIHKEFHTSMGGSNQPCTIKDFIDFLHTNYPDNDSVSLELHRRQLMLKVD